VSRLPSLPTFPHRACWEPIVAATVLESNRDRRPDLSPEPG